MRTDVPFDLRLYGQLAGDKGNLFLSPYSIQVALGMCSAGSQGQTQTCMAELLSMSDDKGTQTKAFGKLIKEVVGDGGERPFELSTANALWMHASFRPNSDYVSLVKEIFRGELNIVDFVNQPDAACSALNEWCNVNTKEKIPKIIERDVINRDTRLILSNVIYFKDAWRQEFDKALTKDHTFHGQSGNFEMPMMTSKEYRCSYYEEPGVQVADLLYKGDLAMTIFLPETTDAFARVERDLLGPGYQRLTQRLSRGPKVKVLLPKFKVTTDYKLSDKLKIMGASLAFSDRADFSGIGSDPDGVTLKISEVVHKAFVDVDEQGTEAAAVTAVVMMRSLSMVEIKSFICDRPFIYVIRNVKTGTILFMGRLVDRP